MTVVKVEDEDTMAVAERLYADLAAAGVDVIIDDRAERPGIKFNDAELVGIPFRITVGPRGLIEGLVQVTDRRTGLTEEIPVDEATRRVAGLIASAPH